jgi:hypothetical protein
MGPKGATGIFGPAGKKGATGLSGPRGNKWDSGGNQPYESVEYDLWIKDDGDLDSYSATGSWNFTGFNFYNSLYFKLYNGIEGPAGVTDKYVIGFKDTLPGLPSAYSFVVGDSSLSTLDSNPNKSKLVVSVADQVTRPLFSFLKSGSSSSGFPSFYWDSLGNSNNLILESAGNLNVVSYLSLKVNTATNGRILLDSYKATINSQSRAYFTGNGNLSFNANTTIGAGSSLIVNSSRLSITTTQFIASSSFYIRTYNFGSTGGYALNSSPVNIIDNGGIKLEVSGGQADRIFQLKDLSGSAVLSARPSSSSSTAGDMAQTIFGSTGSSAGATAGPYTYHVSKVSLTKSTTTSRPSVRPAQNNCTGTPSTIQNIFQIIRFANNVTVISPTSRTNASLNSIYLEIPSSYLSNLEGIYSASHVNPYRIILDDLSANPLTLFIKGIVFYYSNTASSGCYQYVNFNPTSDQNCRFVDITYLPPANSYNPNPRIFYKTCNGTSGYVNMGNVYAISSPPVTPPVSGISTSG